MTPALPAALATRAAWSLLQRRCPGGARRWERTNHAGAPVTLLEGLAFVLGAGATGLATGLTRHDRLRAAAGPVLATAAAGLLGALDDLGGDDSAKGLRGHLAAFRRGRVTTGTVKVVGLVLTGLATAGLVGRPGRTAGSRRSKGPRAAAGAVRTLVGGAVVAGCANLANLFDLRPGRALKVVLLAAGPLAMTGGGGTVLLRGGTPSASIALGSALALLPQDLAGRSMLGDTGANSAGALVGSAVLERFGLRGQLVTLAVVIALTAASEKVSFTRVIEATPVLRELDALGRGSRG